MSSTRAKMATDRSVYSGSAVVLVQAPVLAPTHRATPERPVGQYPMYCPTGRHRYDRSPGLAKGRTNFQLPPLNSSTKNQVRTFLRTLMVEWGEGWRAHPSWVSPPQFVRNGPEPQGMRAR